MTIESQKAFAARLGRDPAYVTRLKQRGVLVGEGGRVLGAGEKRPIEVEASLARMAELGVGQLRPDVAERHAAGRAAPAMAPGRFAGGGGEAGAAERGGEAGAGGHAGGAGPGEGAADADEIEGLPAGEESGLARHKRVALHFQNGLLKIGMALKLGSRFYLKDAQDEGREVGNVLRATLDRLVDQLAPRLAVTREASARRALIESHMGRERRQVKRAFPASLRRLRKSGRESA